MTLAYPDSLREAVSAAQRRLLAPPTRLTVSQWADRYRMLSAGVSAEPGRWRTSRTPYLREIMDAMGDDAVRELVVLKSSQVGYTEALLNYIGWGMSESPAGMLLILPTVETAQMVSREKLAPMLRDTPRLHGLIRHEGARRHADDTLQRKAFPGGQLVLIGAMSAAQLRGRSIPRVILDERDAMVGDADGEGDPSALAWQRAQTFWDRTLIEGGTPTLEGSPTWRRWEESDQREYHVPCPACGGYQPLRWRDDDGSYLIVCDRGPAGELLPATAQYRCAHCAVLISERDKPRMLAAGRWVAGQPGRAVRGYRLWAAYSPWKTWAEIVAEFERARATPETLQPFVNQTLGEVWREQGERIDVHTLAARAEAVDTVPPEVGILTAGVDVQADRLECLVVGWGDREESWVLEWHQLDGDPTRDDVWRALDDILATTRDGVPLAAVGVDTGYQTDRVWRWIDSARGAGRVLCGLKGMPGRGRMLMQRPHAQTKRRERRPWLVGVDTAKDLLQLRLRAPVPGPGAVHFSASLDAVYYDQLTAEQVVTTYRGGRPVREWRLIAGRRNEGLDLTVYALAALHALGPQVVASLGTRAAARVPPAERDTTPDTQPATLPARRPASPRSPSWMQWRR